MAHVALQLRTLLLTNVCCFVFSVPTPPTLTHTDPNYNPLRGGLVGGPDDTDAWSDDRDMNNPANAVSLLNSAGFSAALAALVDHDINMAKCQQGNGFIQTIMLKAKGQPDAAGQRWWEGV